MNPSLHSNRVSKLKKRFQDVLSGSVKLDSRGAILFLEGLCAQDDPVACLVAVTESAHGLSSVQSAMRFDLSGQFMNGMGSTVLQYLLKASGVGGDALDNLLFHVVEPPIFWDVFVRTFQQGALDEDAQLVFAEVLSRLLTLQDRDISSYRDIAAHPSIQDSLITSSKPEIREMGHRIKHILSSSSPLTVHDALNGPGGRHDNDFADYRDIAILPTADEISCQKPPFLRTALDDELEASETPVRDHLDNTFRMLREDMIFDIREEIKAALQEKGKYRGLRVNVSMVGIHTGPANRKTPWGIKLLCENDFSQLKALEGESERVKFLKRDPSGSKILRHQSLVCLTSGRDIISFGTVNRVEELLASKPPVIVLQLDGNVNIKKTVISLRAGRAVRLVHIATAVFAFEPVLAALKKCSAPLSDDIILWDQGSSIEPSRPSIGLSRVANLITSDSSVDVGHLLNLPKSILLDAAQARSLVAGLQQRISLIQGPPGTGKSFIGALLAKAIHDETAQTVLVICYTNHALDQFLADLLKHDIPARSIVRLGGRSNQDTDHLSLHKQPRQRVSHAWDEINAFKNHLSEYEHILENEFGSILGKDLMMFLERKYDKFFDAFHVPPETEDGMTRVGGDGRAMDSNYLFLRWKRGLDAGALSGEPHIQTSAWIWGMDHSSRQRLLDTWQEELVTGAVESICDAGKRYNTLQDAIKREFAKPTVETLRQKRIIACTTTGAAIHAEALEQVGPGVLLVEEAGEILESHILTALSQEVNQMILIGDHKQLRPKVNNYQLTVEKGEGFELNRSLFERLVLKGYPHETLSTQHRMRPEISAFVRELTYPELVDAPTTYQRPDIRGVQSNVIFVDHSHPEDDDSLIADRADDGTKKSSKQNTYEVQIVLKIVRYLAQQGYKSDDIVILTPYLGQLRQLRDALRDDNDPVLNDLDSLDLARAGLSLSAPPALKAKKNQIHLATIDNYQGEESDIVVTSLTRSNQSGAIGFMDSPERLNVLLSRARDGLILIGNSRTFLHSRKGGALWRRFFNLLEKGQYVYQGFPVKCERHPGKHVLLKRARDFDDHCPDGGCTELCEFTLACGHTCTLKCHPPRTSALNNPHETPQCKHKLSVLCEEGLHRIIWKCRLGRPSVCSACHKEAQRREEIARQEREAQRRREEAEAEHCREIAEMEAELEAERAAEQRRQQEERDARMREEQRRQRQEQEARKREEEDRRRQVGMQFRFHQEAVERAQRDRMKKREAERERQEQARAEAERQERLAEEERRRQEVMQFRLHQDAVERSRRELMKMREAERERQEQVRAEAERQERLAEARKAARAREAERERQERVRAEAERQGLAEAHKAAMAREERQRAVAERQERLERLERQIAERKREEAAKAAAKASETSRCTIQ